MSCSNNNDDSTCEEDKFNKDKFNNELSEIPTVRTRIPIILYANLIR